MSLSGTRYNHSSSGITLQKGPGTAPPSHRSIGIAHVQLCGTSDTVVNTFNESSEVAGTADLDGQKHGPVQL